MSTARNGITDRSTFRHARHAHDQRNERIKQTSNRNDMVMARDISKRKVKRKQSAQKQRNMRKTLYKIETKKMLRLRDLLEHFEQEECMKLEREIMNALALNAQATHSGRSNGTPSKSRYPTMAKESASIASNSLEFEHSADIPCIIVEVEYYDPRNMSEEELRKFSHSTLSVVTEQVDVNNNIIK